MKESNAGRPLVGMEFVEPDMKKRYELGKFDLRPSKMGQELYERNENGESIRELSEDIGLPETNIKRIVRNVRAWHSKEEAVYLSEESFGLR